MARPMAMAKPTATGVNELRPPDQIAAHQAATTSSPEARPTPSVSPAGALASSRPTSRAIQAPNASTARAAQQPQPDRQPDLAVGDRDGELAGEREEGHEALTAGPPPPPSGSTE